MSGSCADNAGKTFASILVWSIVPNDPENFLLLMGLMAGTLAS
jgi:hypothetical protein